MLRVDNDEVAGGRILWVAQVGQWILAPGFRHGNFSGFEREVIP